MKGMTRRRFLQYGAGAGAALALPWAAGTPAASAAPGLKLTSSAVPLCPTTAIPNEPAWPSSPEPSS